MSKNKLKHLKESITNNPSFTVKEQAGYASGVFGNCMGQDSVRTFSNKFFRNFMGIENTRITILQNVQLVANVFINPIAGNILDKPSVGTKNTPTKKLLMLTPIPFAIASMLLFVVPSNSGMINFVWALIFKLIFGISDAFYDMSLSTMSLRMTNNANDRKNFYTIATFASALGSMLPGWVIPIAVGSTDNALTQKWIYFGIALIFCILGVASMLAPCFTLNEKIRVERKEKDNNSVISWDRETISSVLHNRTFIIIQIGNFFEQIRSCSYELLVYLYDDVFNDYRMKAVIDAISGALSYIGLGTVPFITSKISASRVVSFGYAFTGTMYAIMSTFSINFNLNKVRKYRYLIGLIIGIAGMPNHAISAAKNVIVADSTDYMEWYAMKKFNRPIRSEGLINAIQSLCKTIFELTVINIYNPLFKKIGYKESLITKGSKKSVQSTSTLKGLFRMFTLFGVVGNILAAITYLFDKYTGKQRDAILAELETMRENNKEIQETVNNLM